MLATVEAQPGLTFRGAVRASGLATGTVGHHVGMLQRSRRVWVAQAGLRRLHFPGPRPTTPSLELAQQMAALDGLDSALLDYAASQPGASQRLVFDAFAPRPRATLQNRLARLVARGFLVRTLSGRYVLYHAASARVASGEALLEVEVAA